MKRAKRAAHFLMVQFTLLGCLLAPLPGTTAGTQEEAFAEVSGQTVPISADEGQGTDDRQEEDEVTTPPVKTTMVPPMMPSGQ